MKKQLEKLNSKKFDLANMGKIVGGETTYGPDKQTDYGRDCNRMTYNPEGYPPGTQGDRDACAIK